MVGNSDFEFQKSVTFLNITGSFWEDLGYEKRIVFSLENSNPYFILMGITIGFNFCLHIIEKMNESDNMVGGDFKIVQLSSQ